MRSLLILGGLAVCVLLVTPSRGDRTEDGGGKDGISNLREFFGQNEDGRADVIEAIGQQALPRSRRQEPPETSKPRKRKPCIGCFSSLSVKEDEPRRSKKMKRNEVAGTPPPLPGMFGLVSGADPDTSRPPRTRGGEGRRGKKKKKNGGKRRHKKKGEGKKRGHHHHHHPESEKEEKIKRRSGGHSLLTASRYGAREEDLGGGMEKGEGKTRNHHHHHHPESEKEEEGSWRYGARGPVRSSRYGGRKEDLEDGTEAAERKRRQSDQSKKGRKENKRSGSRSLITAGSPGAQQT